MNDTIEAQIIAAEEGKARVSPLWKALALDLENDPNFTYGWSCTVEWLEAQLKCKRDTSEFAFAMISLRNYTETEHGYYIASEEGGKRYTVPEPFGHEDVAQRFDRRVRRYAVRSVALRSATLMNDQAKLSDTERQTMETNLEHSATRLVLLSRAKGIADHIKKTAPKLLQSKHIKTEGKE
jgi:hypothetical protein